MFRCDGEITAELVSPEGGGGGGWDVEISVELVRCDGSDEFGFCVSESVLAVFSASRDEWIHFDCFEGVGVDWFRWGG